MPAKLSADRKASHIAKHTQVQRQECANPKRRKRYEADLAKWLRYYLKEAYTRPFDEPHMEIINGAKRANDEGGRFAIAAERGIGKSAILWGIVLYLALTGKQAFPVCVPWAAPALKRAFQFWKNALCFNERLLADYPEYCAPFAHGRGVHQKIANSTWADTKEPTRSRMAVGDGLIVFPDDLGAMGGSTINGNIRGLNYPSADGHIVRPSLVMLDDVQDRKTAKSQQQVIDTVALIDGDVAGCGAAGKELPMLMACNCICAGDVSQHYLESADWQSVRIPCVKEWPEGWDKDDSDCRRLWEEWLKLFHDDEADEYAFYKEHKDAMTGGMELSAPGTFATSKQDAAYLVMVNYHRMGNDAFMAERQQDPVDPTQNHSLYVLTPSMIEARQDAGRSPLKKPDWVTYTVASTDVNPSYALSTVVLGFGQDQTCAVLWYGLHKLSIKGRSPTREDHAELYNEIVKHGRDLSGMATVPDEWVIDGGGYNFDPVVRATSESTRLVGIPAMTYTGRNSTKYRPYGRTADGNPREQCHRCATLKDNRHIKWVVFNSDYWREIAQRSWLGALGTPGSSSLFEGGHGEFARQICAEPIIDKAELGGQTVWKWKEQPGVVHDYGDCMAQGFAAAAFYGIGTGGAVIRKTRRMPERKAKR